MQRLLVHAVLALFCVLRSAPAAADSYGSYVGRVVVQWNDDGRSMTLIEPFAYVDPKGVRWEAPVGTRIDGASIPRFAWSIVGGPFEGKYRASSVVHDVACNERRRDWQDVHLMFHKAMLASGVDERIALIMYAAVYHFGPRWPREVMQTIKATAGDDVAALASRLAGPQRKDELPAEVIGVARMRGIGDGPKTAVVQFKPKPSALAPKDFEALKDAIERRNLTIEDVQNFMPRHTSRQ
jgi:hypothetical protein